MTDQVALVVLPSSKLIADMASTGRADSFQHWRTEYPFREDKAVISSDDAVPVAETSTPAKIAARKSRLMIVTVEHKME